MSLEYDRATHRLLIKNGDGVVTFDSDYAMMISFGVVDGVVILPEYTSGAAHRVFENSFAVASNLAPQALFALGHAKFDAGSYFTGAWCAVGGSAVILNRQSGAGRTKYTVWTSIENGTLYLKSRQYLSPNLTAGQATVTYRLAIMGFAVTSG